MNTIDPSILEKGYSVYKSIETEYYFAMPANEVKRIHRISMGKPHKDLDDSIKVSVVELVLDPAKTFILLNEDPIIVQANQLMPIPVKLD
jgi:hypothetical protein